MKDEEYLWKDAQRKNRPKQRYSWFGLAIALALLLCSLILVSEAWGSQHGWTGAIERKAHACRRAGQVAIANNVRQVVTCVEVEP